MTAPRNPRFTKEQVEALKRGFDSSVMRSKEKQDQLIDALMILKNQVERGLEWGRDIPRTVLTSGNFVRLQEKDRKPLSAADVQAVIDYLRSNRTLVKRAYENENEKSMNEENYKAVLDGLSRYANAYERNRIPYSTETTKQGATANEVKKITPDDMQKLERYFQIRMNELRDQNKDGDNILHYVARNASADTRMAAGTFIAGIVVADPKYARVELPDLFHRNKAGETPLDSALKSNNQTIIHIIDYTLKSRLPELIQESRGLRMQENTLKKTDKKAMNALRARDTELKQEYAETKAKIAQLQIWAKKNNVVLGVNPFQQVNVKAVVIDASKFKDLNSIIKLIQSGDSAIHQLTDYLRGIDSKDAAKLLNAKDADGNTLLHHLAMNAPFIAANQAKLNESQVKFQEYGGIAGELINLGADASARDKNGKTFVSVAVSDGKPVFLGDVELMLGDKDAAAKQLRTVVADAVIMARSAQENKDTQTNKREWVRSTQPESDKPAQGKTSGPELGSARKAAAAQPATKFVMDPQKKEGILKILRANNEGFDRLSPDRQMEKWRELAEQFMARALKDGKDSESYEGWRKGAEACYQYILSVDAKSRGRNEDQVKNIEAVQGAACSKIAENRNFACELNIGVLLKTKGDELNAEKNKAPMNNVVTNAAKSKEQVTADADNQNRTTPRFGRSRAN